MTNILMSACNSIKNIDIFQLIVKCFSDIQQTTRNIMKMYLVLFYFDFYDINLGTYIVLV